MDFDKIMSGIGIIIDDALNPEREDKSDHIFNIIKQIDSKSIPYCKYYELPDDEALKHFRGVSFILLDWDLSERSEEEKLKGVTTGSTLGEGNIKRNIEFLKKIKRNCFVPVFIFSALDTEAIIHRLKEDNLYEDSTNNFIFVKRKSDLIGDSNLLNSVGNWIKGNSSIYALKEWESKYYNAKNTLFWNFYNINQEWPKILWKAYKDDSVNMSNELGELITRNLIARMTPFTFESDIIGRGVNGVSKEDIRKVMEGERFIKQGYLDKNEIHTGDIFKEEYSDNGEVKYRYWLNIRPQCDLIPRNDKKTDSIKLYLLEGEPIDYPVSKSKLNDVFNIKDGNFREQINNGILFPVDDSIIKFSFVTQHIKAFRGFKSRRIGRILPPYITRIQQRYALYLQREGLPRIPKEAIW